uniref:Enoyl-CoA delta isomerase 2, mitochondrial n=1 Tax=Phallusia mammillata TaxID=59560 RepID=A0A6F9DCB5_9ASCI|nr:enoyl-CoA delta isomerase 2, mitochondrial [Phallusia mammillata]
MARLLRAPTYLFLTRQANRVLNSYQTIRCMSAGLDGDFDAAKERLNTLTEEPGNDVKLRIYALFKQATIGENTSKKPGTFNFVGQAKWTAWSSLGKMTQDEAKSEYVKLVDELAGQEVADTTNTETSNSEYKNLIVTQENKITTITLNRPTRKNALTVEMYEEIIVALNTAAKDSSTIAVITGTGDYYCSGNDLENFKNINPSNMNQIATDSGDLLRRYVSAYIDFPKPLIAAINGPAIGVSVTVLGLFDVVFASDNATFSTPFSSLGQSPEGCASYTFPKIMGHAKACEMIMFNKKIDAQEALSSGLVTKVFPQDSFQTSVASALKEIVDLPAKSLLYSKALMRGPELEQLHKTNIAECDRLIERWQSDDCANAIMKFFAGKEKH